MKTDIQAALDLVEPPGIRLPLEKPKSILLRMLAKYSEFSGMLDMKEVAKMDDSTLAKCLLECHQKYGMLETSDFKE